MGKKPLFLAVSLAISGLLLFQIFSQNSINQWSTLLARIRVDWLGLYLGLYGVGFSLRTWRYHLLIKGAGKGHPLSIRGIAFLCHPK